MATGVVFCENVHSKKTYLHWRSGNFILCLHVFGEAILKEMYGTFRPRAIALKLFDHHAKAAFPGHETERPVAICTLFAGCPSLVNLTHYWLRPLGKLVTSSGNWDFKAMEDKSHRGSISGSSATSHTQSQSHAHTSVSQSVTGRSRRGKATGAARRQGATDREKGADSLIKVLDPDTKEDRTPLSLLRALPKTNMRTGKRPVADSGATGSQYSEAEPDDRSFSRIGESTESDSTTNKSMSMSMSEVDDGIEPLNIDGMGACRMAGIGGINGSRPLTTHKKSSSTHTN